MATATLSRGLCVARPKVEQLNRRRANAKQQKIKGLSALFAG